MTGQMSLFDLVDDEQKKEFEIPLPKWESTRKRISLRSRKKYLGVT